MPRSMIDVMSRFRNGKWSTWSLLRLMSCSALVVFNSGASALTSTNSVVAPISSTKLRSAVWPEERFTPD